MIFIMYSHIIHLRTLHTYTLYKLKQYQLITTKIFTANTKYFYFELKIIFCLPKSWILIF